MLTFIAMRTSVKAAEPSRQVAGMPRLPAQFHPIWLTDATAATATTSIRRRRLPAEQAIWLVVALALYRHQSASEVVDALDIALPAKDGAFVSKSAITQARQGIGAAPLKWLFRRSACEWANESEAQSTFKGLTLFAMDGTTLRTADSQCNRAHFGSQLSGSGRVGSYPQARAVTLSSIDTHIVRDAEIGPYGKNEMLTARQLVPRIPDHSVTVFDKGFMSAQILWSLRASGASRHFIIPAKSNTRWQHIEGTKEDQLVLLKVSQPARRANPGMPEHWHARAIRTTDAKGRERTLLTSLTDRRRFRPEDIASTYRRRWQIETSYLELKDTMLGAGLTLRSQTVDCVYQEFWGALAYLHCASKTASTETRRFGLKAELLINGKPYTVDYHWRCSRLMEKSAPVSAWSISPPAGPLLKLLSGDAALFMRAPSYCSEPSPNTATNELDLPVIIVDSPSNPVAVQVFNKSITRGVGYNVVVKSESIYPIDHPVDDYVLSLQEKAFRAFAEDRQVKFQSVHARIEPPSQWESSTVFREYLTNKTGIVIAEPPLVIRSNVGGQDGAHNFFPFDRNTPQPHRARDWEKFAIPLRVKGDSWELQANDDVASASIFVRVVGKEVAKGYPLPPKVTVMYSGVAVPVIGAQEIFDTDRHRLIELVNEYQPLSMIGAFGVR
ncbi:IS4 family transposase [Paraburkholderia dilworthii]|uniref:IS4 family transposase n=1 Tax=Paraburkholderia dilworthii TaxID=948106 RepID=UPI001378D1CE